MVPHIAGAADKVVQSVWVPVMLPPDESPDGIFKVASSVSVARLSSNIRQSKIKNLIRSSSQTVFMCWIELSQVGRM